MMTSAEVERTPGEPVTVAIVNAKTGAVKMLHPEVAEVAAGTGKVAERRARSAAQLEEEAEAAKQRAGGAPVSEWARRQTAEIRQVRDELRAARREAYSAEVPLAGGDGFREREGRAPHASRHNRPLSAAAPSRRRPGASSPPGSPSGRGARAESPVKPRWIVPARALSNKERMTAREREFQDQLKSRREGQARFESEGAAEMRERAKRDAMLPWWERSEKDHQRKSNKKAPGRGPWYPGKPASPSKRSPSRASDGGRLLSPADPLREFQYPPPPQQPLAVPARAFTRDQVAVHVGRGGHDAISAAKLAEEVATQMVLDRWGHALARLLEVRTST